MTDIESKSVVEYTASAELEGQEIFVVDEKKSLTELEPMWEVAKKAVVLRTRTPRDLDLTIQFYAMVGGDNNSPVMWVKRTNPRISHRRGRFLAIAAERLEKIEEPVFSFSPGFDFIVAANWLLINNQLAFERFFRDIGLVERHIEHWTKGITDFLPMKEESIGKLQEVAKRDSRTWRRLREIERRGHLQRVNLTDVEEYAKKIGLDSSKIVQDGHLVFDESERFSFLHLLNEDLYRGLLTEETFEAQRKTLAGIG